MGPEKTVRNRKKNIRTCPKSNSISLAMDRSSFLGKET
ncbi:hypothetical protein LEP1GSC005_3693 [Leptospira santarosai str. ST188]|nr:hypothetical protein LEP1GSC071_1980 [Leptospira santarosai str. JET]EMF91941.1 hypothetical protein LEP1GSC005_3693 [Leptospira santarosai str. ST188]EMO83160.1 hypothetical protein LEP1GSC070_2552 [Leptospira santarosai str. AIM]